MSLKEKLLADMKAAMIAKDRVKKDAIQMTRAAILQVEKDKRITLDDQDIVEIVAKEVKKRKDSLDDYQRSQRDDLINQINREIEVLTEYLPAQLTEQEIKQIVSDSIKEAGASSLKDMGKVMKVIMPKLKGRADGRIVNKLVKEYLTD